MVLGSAKHQAGKNCIRHVRVTFFQSLNAVFKPHVLMCLVPSQATAFDSKQACISTNSKQQCYNMIAQSGRPQSFKHDAKSGQIISSSEMDRILILHRSTWPVERQQTTTMAVFQLPLEDARECCNVSIYFYLVFPLLVEDRQA